MEYVWTEDLQTVVGPVIVPLLQAMKKQSDIGKFRSTRAESLYTYISLLKFAGMETVMEQFLLSAENAGSAGVVQLYDVAGSHCRNTVCYSLCSAQVKVRPVIAQVAPVLIWLPPIADNFRNLW